MERRERLSVGERLDSYVDGAAVEQGEEHCRQQGARERQTHGERRSVDSVLWYHWVDATSCHVSHGWWVSLRMRQHPQAECFSRQPDVLSLNRGHTGCCRFRAVQSEALADRCAPFTCASEANAARTVSSRLLERDASADMDAAARIARTGREQLVELVHEHEGPMVGRRDSRVMTRL